MRFARADREAFLAVYQAYASALRPLVTRFFPRPFEREEAAVFRLSLLEERGHDDVAVALRISARRCKYLRMKLLARMAAHPQLQAALREVLEP